MPEVLADQRGGGGRGGGYRSGVSLIWGGAPVTDVVLGLSLVDCEYG